MIENPGRFKDDAGTVIWLFPGSELDMRGDRFSIFREFRSVCKIWLNSFGTIYRDKKNCLRLSSLYYPPRNSEGPSRDAKDDQEDSPGDDVLATDQGTRGSSNNKNGKLPKIALSGKFAVKSPPLCLSPRTPYILAPSHGLREIALKSRRECMDSCRIDVLGKFGRYVATELGQSSVYVATELGWSSVAT
ncbi:hypothetical protein F2Q70_00035294 [Brassica cretica]|uniref:Uncharacterized protein n=1 Tax=Brassica cretica TaxID=69181 RepID=A0A8S9JX11_BRACR|nr:hypothetical protein F2Q70_00035294 [Brassica cretica]